MRLYQILARLSDMRNRTAFPDQKENIDMFANDLVDKYLPHGSGFDVGCDIDTTKSNDQRLVIYSSYHPMDEVGMYIDWIDFQVTVRASFMFQFYVDVKGPFSRRNLMMLKEYITDEFHECLSKEISVNFKTLEEM